MAAGVCPGCGWPRRDYRHRPGCPATATSDAADRWASDKAEDMVGAHESAAGDDRRDGPNG